MTKRPRKRQRWQGADEFDESRTKFREAAHAMIRSGGYSTLSMRALAEKVGASPMTAYRYYSEKDALLDAVRQDIWEEFGTKLANAAGRESSPEGQFANLCRAYLAFAVEHEQEFRLAFEVPKQRNLDLGENEPKNDAWDLLKDLVCRVARTDDQEIISRYAHWTWASLHGLAMLHLSGRLVFSHSITALAGPMINSLSEAIGRCRTA